MKQILGNNAIEHLAVNLKFAYPELNSKRFKAKLLKLVPPLELKARSELIADTMHEFLPKNFNQVSEIIIKSLTPPLTKTSGNGLSPMFYMPHCTYVSKYGTHKKYNNNEDPFDTAMDIQYQLTQRFTCEFSMRSFITNQPKRTFQILYNWMNDENPHVRRLCSESTRPRLPWASKLQNLIIDPTPSLMILEQLKNDPDLYVRRSVANHLGDIAKDHLDLTLKICSQWLPSANKELKWMIRHALRNPDKKGIKEASKIRKAAK
mgnify:CR=1 FL=1